MNWGLFISSRKFSVISSDIFCPYWNRLDLPPLSSLSHSLIKLILSLSGILDNFYRAIFQLSFSSVAKPIYWGLQKKKKKKPTYPLTSQVFCFSFLEAVSGSFFKFAWSFYTLSCFLSFLFPKIHRKHLIFCLVFPTLKFLRPGYAGCPFCWLLLAMRYFAICEFWLCLYLLEFYQWGFFEIELKVNPSVIIWLVN